MDITYFVLEKATEKIIATNSDKEAAVWIAENYPQICVLRWIDKYTADGGEIPIKHKSAGCGLC